MSGFAVRLLVAANRDKRVLVFHEDIEACNLIHQVLIENGVNVGVYHSKLRLRERAEMLAAYRSGALNVPGDAVGHSMKGSTFPNGIGIIAASTATRRQRIQRLGRVLRPVNGPERSATIYSLVATVPEIGRLQEEATNLEGVAEVTWSHA